MSGKDFGFANKLGTIKPDTDAAHLFRSIRSTRWLPATDLYRASQSRR